MTAVEPGRNDPFIPDPRTEIEPSPRWVRVKFGGETIADSKRVLLVRESRRLPAYYFPRADVRADLLVPTDRRTPSQHKGVGTYWNVTVGQRSAEHAAWSYADPPADYRAIAGYVTFDWNKMDAWYEEEEEVFVHPRDPYKRVDVIPSSRHVRVVVGGTPIADSRRPMLLFETGLPTRYYLPREDVRMDLLTPTTRSTRCPYKGVASYWTASVGDTVAEDIVWSYEHPIPECPKIAGLLSFYNERVDAIYVDGELETKPRTPWS